MRIWHQAPAREWLEGLPIGTGRLAAMVLGTYKRERIALNHEWLWKGVYRERDTEVRSHLLPTVRRHLLAGRYTEGTRAANDAFAGGGGVSGRPCREDPYQPAGDLYLEFNHAAVHDYIRELDLATASATVSYETGGARLTRRYVAHLVEDLILVRVDHGGRPFDCAAWLDRNHDPDCELAFDSDPRTLTLDGNVRGGVDFRVHAAVWHRGGRARIIEGRKLLLQGISEAVFAVNIGVSASGRQAREECAGRRLRFPVDWDALVRTTCRNTADTSGA